MAKCIFKCIFLGAHIDAVLSSVDGIERSSVLMDRECLLCKRLFAFLSFLSHSSFRLLIRI